MLFGNAQNSSIKDSLPAFSFRQTYTFPNFNDLVIYVNKEGKDLNLVKIIMWTTCFRRNQIRVGNKDYSTTQVIPNARQRLSNFHHANPIIYSQVLAPNPSRVSWIPPPDNSLKINFDGVTFKDIGKASLGVVIRNDQGQEIASHSEQISLPHFLVMVEALAAARAISFAQDLGFSSFVLEGDSELVIKALKSDEDSLSPSGHIIASAKATTEANSCISFSHTCRLGNFVAHNLVKRVRHVRGFLV